MRLVLSQQIVPIPIKRTNACRRSNAVAFCVLPTTVTRLILKRAGSSFCLVSISQDVDGRAEFDSNHCELWLWLL
jgi:hypothetical protein